MSSVAIIGGGITGLTAAHRLRKLGVPVTLYEASPRVGGVIRTRVEEGFLAECGPNTILETSPLIASLVAELGLESQRIYSAPAAKNRYILRDGIPRVVPGSLGGFLKTGLYSLSAKLRIPAELFIGRADGEESVAEFVKRRLGREFLDYAVNPLVAGIYAGDPSKLSVKHAFPKLYAAEQEYRSLFLGQILGARRRAKRGEVSKQSARKFSFIGGLQTLTDALFERLRDVVRLREPARAIRRTRKGWFVMSGEVETAHTAVLLAATAPAMAKITLKADAPFEAKSLSPLAEIPYAPVASLVLGFPRESVAHPLDGFGVLVPEAERRHILGVIFSSSLFPHRAPQGHVTLTCYLGGMRSPALAACETRAATATALDDLKEILGVRGDPVFVHHTSFPNAIPQYEVGFGRFRELMDELEGALPGLHFAGHFRNGVSLGDSIVAGEGVAMEIRAFLERKSAAPPLKILSNYE